MRACEDLNLRIRVQVALSNARRKFGERLRPCDPLARPVPPRYQCEMARSSFRKFRSLRYVFLLACTCLCASFLLNRATLYPDFKELSESAEVTRGVWAQDCARWREKQILKYMDENSSRAYFADLFRKGCFRSGIEVGVADGRFSEHFLRVGSHEPLVWYMVEPFPNPELKKRFWVSSDGTADFSNGTWSRQGVGRNAHTIFIQEFSTDGRLIRDISDNSIDFIYLDGAHDHNNVYRELPMYFRKVKPGGVLAGHDYCNRGESPLNCKGCSSIPKCAKYTEYGIAHGKPPGKLAVNQNGVVRAVQKWLVQDQPELTIHFTREDFSRDSLSKTFMDYDLVVTNTRNPSWYFVKPEI